MALHLAAASNTKAEVITVQLENLYIDIEHYQREPYAAHVANLVLKWDPATAQLLTVNLRDDNTLALVDGQHRVLAMRELGYTSWLAYAWTGLTIPEEAALFVRLNMERRHHRALGKWKALLTAGDPLTLAIERIVTSCGYHICDKSKEQDPHAISCPETLVRIATNKRQQEPDADRVLQVLSFLARTWPDDPHGATNGMLTGLDLFLRKYGGALDLHTAERKFATIPLSTIARKANQLTEASTKSKTVCYCTVLQQAYDKNKQGGRLEPLDDED